MTDQINAQLDKLEKAIGDFADRSEKEVKELGRINENTEQALKKLGESQREIADRLLQIEQKGGAQADEVKAAPTWGSQLVETKAYKAFAAGDQAKARVEVKNTLVGSDTNVAPDRSARIVPGAFQMLTLEALLPSTPTSSNAIEFTKEASFTNNAAEASEGAQKAESALTWSLVNMPISTVAHFIKISKQLAADAPALAAYVNSRMVYGVNRKVEGQLAVGDGTSPNISGMFDTGNYTAHGYANADLGSTLKKLVLFRKVIADLWAAGYPADAIVLNPVDWAGIEIDLLTTSAGQNRLAYDAAGNARLWGIPVVQSVGVAADTFLIGAFQQAYMVHNREGVVVELSDSDGDNFQKNLITVRAERRLALATEVPAAVRGGDLTPA